MDGEENPFLFKARIAEQCERFDDMVKFMKEYIADQKEKPIGVEERNLFSIAYKNVVGSKRGALRFLTSQIESNKSEEETPQMKMHADVFEELRVACNDCINEIGTKLEPNIEAAQVEAKVFFLKMKGDYYRYMAEYAKSDEHTECRENASRCYQEASDCALNLPTTHPVRLGLALNYSVFKYEVLEDIKGACELAKKAFDEARQSLDDLQDSGFNDGKLIMQLLRDNLTLWTSQEDGEDEDGQNDL